MMIMVWMLKLKLITEDLGEIKDKFTNCLILFVVVEWNNKPKTKDLWL